MSEALKNYLAFRNGKTSPERSPQGIYTVFGSNGPIGRTTTKNVVGPFIVIGRVGSYCGSLSYSERDAWVTDNAIICTSSLPAETRYWFYLLQTLGLNDRSSGSGQPLLNQSVLGGIETHVAEPEERLAIAEVLGALDDKIAANTKLVAMAEMLSQSLFSSMLDEDSQLIPLSATAQFINGKAFTKNATGTGRVVIRIAELNSGLGGSTVYNDIDVPEQHIAQPGSILFAWSGSLTLHRWFRPDGIVNQHIFKVIPAAGYPEWLIFELLRKKLDEFKSIAANKATTMGHIQRRHLDEHIQVPSDSMVNRHNLLMQSLWSQGLNAEMENESLAATRDALLPQLMSGKLRVKDAEKLVSAAI